MREAILETIRPGEGAHNADHLFGRKRVILDLRQLAVDAKKRMLPDLQMNIRSSIIHGQGQELIKRF
jgi:hypothetical protein